MFKNANENSFVFIETNRLIDTMSNREHENQSQPYASVVLSPNSTGQSSTNSSGISHPEMGRKHFNFSPDQIQCLCEALQQKGDIGKLAELLCNLPKNELVRPNDSILRYSCSFFYPSWINAKSIATQMVDRCDICDSK